ncbi:hypothetical protein [Kineosporia sp. NBRC 101731]|uniref:hypothetical protein n=1 Tax=Kineosporia sp. NBRC 101731 TaxID=3032199 RepID=UPI0024A098D4|nr:hypothetical protein [Kineosporia sp. NBRC 101731]GLY32129.1 hypothetical protein Kisp02_54940 [Kineosporia sp. NBRC 101731]
MIVDVGDAPVLVWHLRDPETGAPIVPSTVLAMLTGPGVSVSLSVVNTAPGDYQVAAPITVAGDWRLRWTSAGPAQQEEVALYAVPAGMSAAWSPDVRAVAVHIPSRTRDVETNAPLGTFNDDTNPTGEQVDRLTANAVAVVSGFVGTPIVPAAYGLCQAAAALWAAYWVELGYPERDADVSVYGRLRDDAVLLMEQARAVNVGSGGGQVDPPDEDGQPNVLSVFSFPPPGRVLIL